MERKKEKERKKERVKVQNIETDNYIFLYRCQQIKLTKKKESKKKKGECREHRDR